MKIATWNVNSVRKRTGNLVAWLQEAKPDIVVLQELKAQEPQFPTLEVEAAGYKAAIVGQKGFNGVAFLSHHAFDVTARALPGAAEDEPARYVEGRVFTPRGPLTVGGLYLPNGNPVGTEKFTYKLAWMERLLGHARRAAGARGDVRAVRRLQCLPDRDGRVRSQGLRRRRALPARIARGVPKAAQSRPDRRGAGRSIPTASSTRSGTTRPAPGPRATACASITCCSHRRPPTASPAVGIDKAERGKTEPSDHVPVWCELDVAA